MSQGHANLASAYKDAARQDAAIASYRRALALRPDFPEAFANLVHSQQVERAVQFRGKETQMGSRAGSGRTHGQSDIGQSSRANPVAPCSMRCCRPESRS